MRLLSQQLGALKASRPTKAEVHKMFEEWAKDGGKGKGKGKPPIVVEAEGEGEQYHEVLSAKV